MTRWTSGSVPSAVCTRTSRSRSSIPPPARLCRAACPASNARAATASCWVTGITPQATRSSIDAAGWMHSGDLATMDDQGYVRIVGRLKDMLIRGGENIYPREIEEFLYTHPGISDVQVIGVPMQHYGEEVMAWVKLRDGMTAPADELAAFCKGRIATFKIPRYWKFVDDFPMTVTGKIQKFRMREMAVAELAA